MTTDAPPPEFPRRRAIAALVANIGALIFCFPLGGIIGTVVAGIGLSRAATSPDPARALVKWAWIVFGISVGLALIYTIWSVATDSIDSST